MNFKFSKYLIADENESMLLKTNCPQLLLPSKQGVKCVCGTGYHQVDNATCRKYDGSYIL